ncbi:glycosyltransferase family 2 protein [Roseomonas sp. NAR14]|uniref:Glycosyltransferase family 2 protein n=2 Tax=Roseomonas acroporae TaxID=2937791 RepID=A0A9X2BY03_9PROT|nr:glycosyltransferase family 2 protein [Roseomonas acroporae]
MPAEARPRPADPLLTLVVPVLNEEQAVPLFLDAVVAVLEGAGLRFELLFVDDGSTDGTVALLARLAAADRRIRVVALSRNFGKEAAMSAGLDRARGDAVVLIDVDLQDPPELIPTLVARWREGYEVVYGSRADRSSDTALKRMTAGWFYGAFNRVANTRIPPDAGDFRLVDRAVVEALRRLPERGRFMKGLFAWVGFRTVGVPFERAERAAGESKWNYWRLWNFALDGITSFSTVPLRVWTYLGAVIALLSFLYAMFIVVRVLVLGIDLPGYPSMMAVLLFLGGVQLLSLGVIGEYLGRLFVEVKGRPLYLVAREIGPPDTEH